MDLIPNKRFKKMLIPELIKSDTEIKKLSKEVLNNYNHKRKMKKGSVDFSKGAKDQFEIMIINEFRELYKEALKSCLKQNRVTILKDDVIIWETKKRRCNKE